MPGGPGNPAPPPPPEGMPGSAQKAQTEIRLVAYKTIGTFLSHERHRDASGQATNTQSNRPHQNAKDRRQAASIGSVSPTSK